MRKPEKSALASVIFQGVFEHRISVDRMPQGDVASINQ